VHDHHGSGADGGARLNLLPLWLQVLWALVMGAVVARYLIACGFGQGVDRLWSGAHAILATGMLHMFLPWSTTPLRREVSVTAYCALLFITLTILAARWIATGSLQRMGLLISIDSAAMAYMSQMAEGGGSPITYLLVVYYAASAVAWTRGKTARAAHAAMAAAMAYMFFAMGSASSSPIARVFLGNNLDLGMYSWLLSCGVLVLWIASNAGAVQRLSG
jgi:hypothetical protein